MEFNKAKWAKFIKQPRLSLGVSWWLGQWRVCLQCRRPGSDPWVGKIPWRRKWQPTQVCLPGEFHGQKNLAGCSPQGRTESNTTEWLTYTHTHTFSGAARQAQGALTLGFFGQLVIALWKWLGRIFIEEGGVLSWFSWFSSQIHLPDVLTGGEIFVI